MVISKTGKVEIYSFSKNSALTYVVTVYIVSIATTYCLIVPQ